ncbi:MAG TPA: O-antigen ligase family protein [Gemmatimonadales bacterium]
MTTLGANEPLGSDLVAAVRQATEAPPPRRSAVSGFSLSVASQGERLLIPLVGIYLGYAVVRLPEVFIELALPHLPMILMLIFMAMLVVTVPTDAWQLIWRRSPAFRLVMMLAVLAFVTAPIGIWPSESFQFFREKYLVVVIIFICCLVFLRDRRSLRLAVAIYVLCVAAVSYNVLHTYDPNAVVLNEDGDPIDPDVLAARPELRRLQMVGVSLDPNDFGAVLGTTFPLALWLSVGSFRRRVFWTGIAGLMVAAVVPTQSRGSELGFLAAAVVIVAAGARGWRRWFSFALVAGCVAMFVMMATGIGAGARFSDFSSDDYNVSGNEGRLYFWKQGMIWMIKRPWGYGISNFSTYFGMLNGEERAAHSSWVQYGMELGVAGLVLFILLCYSLVKGLRAIRKRAAARRAIDPEAKTEETLAGHMLAMLTGVLVTGTFLSNAYYPLMYMALGLAGATVLGSKLPEENPAEQALPPAPGRGVPRRRLRAFPGPASTS